MLEFVYKKMNYGAYCEWESVKHIGSDPFRRLVDDTLEKKPRTMLTTCIVNTLFRGKHLVAVDCDKFEDMQQASDYLSRNHIIDVVESSPDHFWIITDHATDLKTAIKIMQDVPGADKDHVRSSGGLSRITFRAFPKQVGYPKMGSAVFPDGPARLWLKEFRDYFTSGYYVAITELMKYYGLIEGGFARCSNCKAERITVGCHFCPRCGQPVEGANHDSSKIPATARSAPANVLVSG